jgi:iron complex outermembrane receptor protein
MKVQNKAMLRTTLLASVATAACLSVPFIAHAADAKKDVDVSEIVVTGSRIHRADLTSIQPMQVLDTRTIEDRGFTNVADALNELPVAGVPINPIGPQGSFGTGRNFINLFNLGSNRTLTLVNGRRFVGGNPASIFSGASAGGQVDLNVIPTGLIDRIETVQAGGAAVYGSDAIAGVVNIIMKNEFEGAEVDGEYGVSDRGDGQNYRGRITAGHNFLSDRLKIYGSYEYNKTEALSYSDRPFAAQQLAFAKNPQDTGPNDTIPGAIIIFGRRIPETTAGGLPTRTGGIALSGILTIPDPANPGQRIPAQFGPGGILIPYNTGAFYQPSIASGGDGLNLAPLTSLQAPLERHVLTGFGKFALTDNVRLFGEGLFNKTTSSEAFRQPIYNAPLFGGNSGPLRFSTANPLLPAATRAAILAQPVPLAPDPASPGDVLFSLSRASTDVAAQNINSESKTYRGVFGIEGDFEFADRKFHWDVSANKGRSEGFFTTPNIVQSRFVQAIDVVRNASGTPVCRDPTAVAAGCAPLNLFGFGSPSQASLDYVRVQFRSDFKVDQTDYLANFGGDIVTLPAGPASFNVGYEYRKEEGAFTPNDPQRLGVGRSAAISAISGSFNTNEYYGEVLVPLFGGDFTFPLLNKLELEGSYRKIRNSQAGSDSAWSYGLRWKPVGDLMFRYSKAKSFRAPAITELFLPTATSFFTATDPCDARNIGGGPSPANRQANCRAAFAALGLPSTFSLVSNVQAATVQGTTAGNPGLKNEIANEWSAGAVYQPHFVPGLTLTVDYTKIDLTNAIANFNLTAILQVCYDSPVAQADACGRFLRGNAASGTQAGQVLTADTTQPGPRTGFINAGYTHFSGLTFGAHYDLDLADIGSMEQIWGTDPGRLNLSLDGFHEERRTTSVTGLGFDQVRSAGVVGDPKLRWRFSANYLHDPLSVTWTTNFVSSVAFNNDFTMETRYPLRVAHYFVHDLAISYKLDSLVGSPLGLHDLKARFIVNNVFDETPPYGLSATGAAGVYDLIGRYYQIGLTGRF